MIYLSIICVVLLISSIFLEIFLLVGVINRKNLYEEAEKHFSHSLSLDKDVIKNSSVYVIALPERKKYIENSLNTYGLKDSAILVDAILKKDLDPDILKKHDEFLDKDHNLTNLGEIACYLSHLKVMKKFLLDEKKKAIIFEDDITPCASTKLYQSQLHQLRKELTELENKGVLEQYDIIYLGNCWSNCLGSNFITQHLATNSESLCNHAYVINKKAAKIILDNSILLKTQIDLLIVDLIKKHKLKSLTLFPQIFSQNRNVTGTTLGIIPAPMLTCNSIINPHYFR